MKANGSEEKEDYLYHFTKSDTLMLHILDTMELKMNMLSKTNDPRENLKYRLINTGSFYDTSNLNGLISKQEKEAEINKLIKDNCRVACFCEDYFDEDEYWDGFNHPRMWSQYAENHQGVCLKIDKQEFLKENELLFQNSNAIHKSVTYRSKASDYVSIDYKEFHENPDKYLKSFFNALSDSLFFTKDLDWKTESEYRVIAFGKEELMCSVRKSLKEIILGVNFSPAKVKLLKKVTSGSSYRIMQAIYQDGAFDTFELSTYTSSTIKRPKPFSFDP